MKKKEKKSKLVFPPLRTYFRNFSSDPWLEAGRERARFFPLSLQLLEFNFVVGRMTGDWRAQGRSRTCLQYRAVFPLFFSFVLSPSSPNIFPVIFEITGVDSLLVAIVTKNSRQRGEDNKILVGESLEKCSAILILASAFEIKQRWRTSDTRTGKKIGSTLSFQFIETTRIWKDRS